MKKTSLWFLLLSLFYIADAHEIETSSQILFLTTPEGQHVTLGISQSGMFTANGKDYMNYSGTNLGDNDWYYEDSLFYLRKDGTKYFYYDSKTCLEHLLFDFDLKEGNAFTNDFEGTVYKVTDVRDTLVNDETLRLIELQNSNGKSDIWMEGVGSIYTGILPPQEKYKDARLLISRYFGYDDYWLDGYPTFFYLDNYNIKTADMFVETLRWDKPVETMEEWEAYTEWKNAPTDLNAEFIGDTLHIWGRLNTSCGLQSYAACELNGSQIVFRVYPIEFIPADCINKYEINTKIASFTKGKYNIKLSWNKTIELECLGANPTSVKSISLPSQKNTFFDLQGRKLPSKPARGIYLEDGKKRMVK